MIVLLLVISAAAAGTRTMEIQRGIQAIKEAGGITFAEGKNSASFFGMPSSAIQTGCVDFILAPSAIAQGLIGISSPQKEKDKSVGSEPDR